jgi:beta-galactosidase/beta-glucuronidase
MLPQFDIAIIFRRMNTDPAMPRPEYPRPQFVREDWLCLNGEWEFCFDHGDSGLERGLLNAPAPGGKIVVPFCPESKLSGIEHTDFLHAVWYRRTVTIPQSWAGRRVLLHFAAVDYDATVWIDGRQITRHRGGFTPFTAELPGVAMGGEEHVILVHARDPHKRPAPMGKQSSEFANAGCMYTRTTGIWQTVWMEPVCAESSLKRPRITPDVTNSRFIIAQSLTNVKAGFQIRASLRDAAGLITSVTLRADMGFSTLIDLPIPEGRRHFWGPGNPFLYDIDIELLNASGAVLDRASTYAGLRSVTIEGHAIKINGKVLFQRLVLDQGFYPDGLYTAPTDADLRRDIELSMAAGFNGARLHQKVFEERFLFHADRLGYLVWGEFPDWGCNFEGPQGDNQQPTSTYVAQWLEAVERDYSHPSIVGWCPLNETWQKLTDRITVLDDVTRALFLATKAADATRPVLDTSGYSHRMFETDVYDGHDYEQDPAKFAINEQFVDGIPYTNPNDKKTVWSVPYRNQPYFCSEFGGIWWNPDARPGEDSWGYGNRPTTLAEFYDRFEGLCNVLLGNEKMFGYCYTQLTDVFQEQNGIYRFDRSEKFDIAKIKAVQEKIAAIEKSQA